jgi:hypothetical protein
MTRAELGTLGSKRWGRAAAGFAGLVALACGGNAVGEAPMTMSQAGHSSGGRSSAGHTSSSVDGKAAEPDQVSVGTGGSGGSPGVVASGGSGSCAQFSTAASCRAAGCAAILATISSRDAPEAGGAGGAGGADADQANTCTVQEQGFLTCRDFGGGGAVNVPGCAPDCNTCANGTNVLPMGWLPASTCYWTCKDGHVSQ